jgi:serine/threonine protein kinase, bacterial
MNGLGLRRRLSWLLVTGSVLTATLGTSAGTALAAPQAPQASGGTIKICKCIVSMTADPATNTLWLVNGKAKSISVVSEKTTKVIATIRLASQLGPNAVGHLVADPTTRTIWEFAGSVLVEISDKTMKVEHFLRPQGYRPGFTGAVDPVRGEVWVASEETIQGISESTGKVLSTDFVANGAKSDAIVGLATDPKTGTVLATVNKFGGTRTWIFEIEEANDFGYAVRKLPGSSSGLTIDPSAGMVWNLKGTTLSAYLAASRLKPSGSITISRSRLGGIAVDPTTGSIWMAAASGNRLTRFSESHRNVIRTLPLPGKSFGITVDTKSHTVFTLNSQNSVVRFYRY